MLSTSHNNIMISLLPCCLLYFCLCKDKISIKLYTMLIKLSASWICILILQVHVQHTMYALQQWHPLLTWYHKHISTFCKFILDIELSTTILSPLDFSTQPTLLSQNLLIHKNHTVKLAYKEHGSIKIYKKLYVTRKLISLPGSTLNFLIMERISIV